MAGGMKRLKQLAAILLALVVAVQSQITTVTEYKPVATHTAATIVSATIRPSILGGPVTFSASGSSVSFSNSSIPFETIKSTSTEIVTVTHIVCLPTFVTTTIHGTYTLADSNLSSSQTSTPIITLTVRPIPLMNSSASSITALPVNFSTSQLESTSSSSIYTFSTTIALESPSSPLYWSFETENPTTSHTVCVGTGRPLIFYSVITVTPPYTNTTTYVPPESETAWDSWISRENVTMYYRPPQTDNKATISALYGVAGTDSGFASPHPSTSHLPTASSSASSFKPSGIMTLLVRILVLMKLVNGGEVRERFFPYPTPILGTRPWPTEHPPQFEWIPQTASTGHLMLTLASTLTTTSIVTFSAVQELEGGATGEPVVASPPRKNSATSSVITPSVHELSILSDSLTPWCMATQTKAATKTAFTMETISESITASSEFRTSALRTLSSSSAESLAEKLYDVLKAFALTSLTVPLLLYNL